MSGVYFKLTAAASLEKAVQSLTDAELREVRGELARGEHEAWPANLVHGVCLVESAERFMKVPSAECEVISGRCDKCHGSEVEL